MKYEYQLLVTDTPTCSQEQLNSFGAEGWLLCQVYPWEGRWYYAFARAVYANN